MMLGCKLTIGGTQITSTAHSLVADQPAALDGLRVTWGRSTRLDQPRPSTMSCTLILPTDPSQTLEEVAPGAEVTVTAASTTPPATTTVIGPSSSTSRTTTSPYHLAPAALQTEGTRPEAWDHLPRVSPGALYTATFTTTLPPNTTLHIWSTYYTGPWASTRTQVKVGQVTTSGTHTITWAPGPEYLGQWVGLAMVASPLGPTFAQHTSTFAQHTSTWATLGTYTLTRVTLTRDGILDRTATVFMGRITDAVLSWDSDLNRPTLDLTCADFTSELANMRLGAAPYPIQTAKARIDTVLAALGGTIRSVIDPRPGSRTLARTDIDSQSPASILQNVATSTGAILWPSAHATLGSYYRLEDLSTRRALYQLRTTPDGTAYIDASAKGSTPIPAAAILRALDVERDTTDLATVVTVDWVETTRTADGATQDTTRTATATDTARLATHGYRRISIQTDLNTAAQAQALAEETLARSAAGGWTIPEATWEPHLIPTQDPTDVLRVLDSTTRMGLPLLITGAAPWVPGAPSIPVYLDGGTYTHTRGHWTLGLKLTRASVPGDSLPWNALPPALDWPHMGTITWSDISAVTT